MSNYLIVGASSAAGQDCIARLKAAGEQVISCSRSAADELKESGQIHIQASPMDEGFTAALQHALPDRLDGLLYCPGSIALKPFNRLKESDFTACYELNVLGAVRTVQACTDSLKRSDSAGVVFFSTVAAGTGMPFHSAISSAKAALEGLSRSLAAEYASSGVRFNVIAPSLTDSPMAERLLNSEEKRTASAKRHPLGRIGKPADLGSMACMLMRAESSWITAQVIGIDGGMGATRGL